MKHKSNPWRALIALLLLVTLLVCICTGCAPATASPRLVVEEEITVDRELGDVQAYIIRDTETGVRYLYIGGYQRGGITKLEEAPGEEGER